MNRRRRPARLLTGLVPLTLALAGCGESDLEALHDQSLNDARDEAGLVPGAASPTAGGSLTGDGPEAAFDLDGYTLVFNEEFRDLALDPTRWNTALQWGPDVIVDDELQYYVDTFADPGVAHSPFTLDGETLTISAIETPEELRAAANGQPWLSGALTTAGHFDMTYGYVEVRVDMPRGQGVRPALWMLGSEFADLRPQLFIMERDGAKPDRLFHNYEYVDEAGESRSPGRFEVVEESLSDGFHTVGVAWSPEEFLFVVDGEPRYRIIGENVSRQAMYLVLSLAIGGKRSDAPDAATPRPTRWLIDYVRVWQKPDAS